jgi:hypothetical protein
MIASVAVVMAVFPALLAILLAMGSHVAAESLAPPRLFGSRLLSRLASPMLLLGWWAALAFLLLVAILFACVQLFVFTPVIAR